MGTLGGSRTRINLALDQARLPICGTSAWSLRADLNRLPVPYEGTALPGELQRHGYRGWNRTSVPLGQSQGGMPPTHPVMVRKVRFERTCREV
jgi:hypothetical protein